MDAHNLRSIQRIEAVAAAMASAVEVGAQTYANGGFRATPIVDGHFTAGNQQRYGWEPLSRDYFMVKAGQKAALRKGMKAAGRKGSKLDKFAGFQSSVGGGMIGFGTGANLPMLVRTGATRAAVNSRTHRLDRNGDTVVITFANLPDYVEFLQNGTAKMPKRSPVEPNSEDMAQIQAAMEQFIEKAAGAGGSVPVEARSIPGRARFG